MIYYTLHRKLKIEKYETHKNPWGTLMFLKGKQFLFHLWHPWCYSCYKLVGRSWMREIPDCDYDQQNMPVVIYDTYIPEQLTRS